MKTASWVIVEIATGKAVLACKLEQTQMNCSSAAGRPSGE
jgi:hypothetical protein